MKINDRVLFTGWRQIDGGKSSKKVSNAPATIIAKTKLVYRYRICFTDNGDKQFANELELKKRKPAKVKP